MNRGQLPTNKFIYDINWGALDHASRVPQLTSCNYYVSVHMVSPPVYLPSFSQPFFDKLNYLNIMDSIPPPLRINYCLINLCLYMMNVQSSNSMSKTFHIGKIITMLT